MYNGLALLLVSLHPRFSVHRFAGPAIAVGSMVFSGSIMALVLARDKWVLRVDFLYGLYVTSALALRFKWLGPLTPVGGSIMIAG